MTLRFGCWILLIFCLVACVPATVPVQLDHTPGPGVVITDQMYDSGTFQVAIPAGWRVITSAAGDPVSVIFAAPEGDALIMLGETITDAPHPTGDDGDIRSERREILLGEPDGITVIAILNATPAQWTISLKAFEAVIASLQF